MRFSILAISIFLFDLASAAPMSSGPVDVSVKLTIGPSETSFAVRCSDKCQLTKTQGSTRRSIDIEREDAAYFLDEIAKLPTAKPLEACGRRFMRIDGASREPLVNCLDEKSSSGEAFLKFFRGLDAPF